MHFYFALSKRQWLRGLRHKKGRQPRRQRAFKRPKAFAKQKKWYSTKSHRGISYHQNAKTKFGKSKNLTRLRGIWRRHWKKNNSGTNPTRFSYMRVGNAPLYHRGVRTPPPLQDHNQRGLVHSQEQVKILLGLEAKIPCVGSGVRFIKIKSAPGYFPGSTKQ